MAGCRRHAVAARGPLISGLLTFLLPGPTAPNGSGVPVGRLRMQPLGERCMGRSVAICSTSRERQVSKHSRLPNRGTMNDRSRQLPTFVHQIRTLAASLELPLGSPDPRAVHGRDAMLVAGGFMAARFDRQVQGNMIESARTRTRPNMRNYESWNRTLRSGRPVQALNEPRRCGNSRRLISGRCSTQGRGQLTAYVASIGSSDRDTRTTKTGAVPEAGQAACDMGARARPYATTTRRTITTRRRIR